ncbi:hypothetical protein DVK85_00255 [Flavobacterium arcticum]|uniref:Lipoprotein n=1 Tax=Flavobacterium arcticum TaxID=1784713 RepID=A0A345H837_9FLAO|nr:hypothetical protein [Flavobacterium arcticum]AXG72747.1 hypothetical protein DVK85_00255 [Flavobacterium arcticum]KAF2510982.1 hypothetical protein E0W72_06210 [Flavobacterium arcticum]
MKKLNLVLGAALLAAGLTSCKNDAEMTAERNVDNYESYVDSVQGLDDSEKMANWEAIEAKYQTRLAEAEATIESLKDKVNAQDRIDETKQEYVELKADVSEKAEEASTRNLFVSYFGDANAVGNDMKFAWVNKDNILSVYQKFVNTFEANHESYSRQDFDKIKAWYEALDARKNTVEKEGLSTEDNNKIAGLKLKFAPKFSWERMTAKGDENEAAKEAAE